MILLWILPFNVWAYTSEDCITCHREGSQDSTLHISVQAFQRSAHGSELACEDCHTGVTDKAHEKTKGSGAVECNECHDQENRHGLSGEREKRPQCHSCHSKHAILGKKNRTSAIYRGQLKETCRECHPMESGETGYLAWLPSLQIRSHRKQDFSQDYSKDNCIGCHQGLAVHGEEEPLDGQNCQVCHMNQNEKESVIGTIHPGTDFWKQPGIFIAGVIYQIMILFLLWGVYRFFAGTVFKNRGKRGR